jgi:hypothetical protein
MKRLLIFGLMAVIVSLAIVSCKDDFNEEEFLRLQSDLKLKQDTIIRARNFALVDSTSEKAVKEYIAATNEAGDLLAVSLIVRENGNALPGVTVTLSSGTPNEITGGRAKAVQTGTTDASGNVVFDRVTIGSGTATFSKNGYISATATYDFGQPGAPIAITIPNPSGLGGSITKYVPPIKRYEEAAIPMLSATPAEGSTATITGVVTIENDLTNTTPEVPAGIVLRANFSSLITGAQGFFTSYTLEDDTNLGRATIAANGSYTMTVPASAAGTTISFIIPNIEGTCRMAVNGYDNGTGTAVALAAPEYRNVPTAWGPGITPSATIPFVPGARVVVPAAPAMGSGVAFNVTPVGRSLPLGAIQSSDFSDVGGIRYRISNRGSYSHSAIEFPTVTISGGGGTGAVATAQMQAILTNLVITNRGQGYDGSVNLELFANLQGGGEDVLATSSAISTYGGQLPETISLTSLDAMGLDPEGGAVDILGTYTSLQLRVINGGGGLINPATFNATIRVDVNQVSIVQGGTGYTSAPTFTFSNGGATMEVLEFPVFWNIEPTMGAGTDYAVIPTFNVNIPQSHSQLGSSTTNISTVAQNNVLISASTSLQGQLAIQNGDIIKRFPSHTLRTTSQSHGQPVIVQNVDPPADAKFTFTLFDFDASTGKIVGAPDIVNVGNGYNTQLTGQIQPTISGAPGAGATIQFAYDLGPLGVDYDASSLEWQFESDNSVTIPNPGSGYLPNLNQRGSQTAALPTSQIVQAGKTHTVNFHFGTGLRRAEVN